MAVLAVGANRKMTRSLKSKTGYGRTVVAFEKFRHIPAFVFSKRHCICARLCAYLEKIEDPKPSLLVDLEAPEEQKVKAKT